MNLAIKRLSLCPVLLLLAIHTANPAVGAEQGAPRQLLNSLFSENIEETEKVILVLHRGRPGGRMAAGSRLNRYTARGYSRDATWNQRVARSIADRHGLSYVTDWWMSEIDVNCAVLRIDGETAVDEVITELLDDPDVVTAQRLALFNTLGGQTDDPYFELQTTARYFDLAALHSHTTGKGILIAVVDTGIEKQHQDLHGQIVLSRNFVEEISPGYSEDMHGTAVAGVIAAHANNGKGIVGVAPDSKIVGLKACWPLEVGKLDAICNSFTLALAINQALADGAHIINLSLSGPFDRIVAMLIEKALDQGIVVVAATREEDPSASVSFPASISGVIAVTDGGFNTWRLKGQPVFAPSTHVLTTLPENNYNFVSGTSLGAAQVAGYAALLLQETPGLSNVDIHHRLIDINNRNIGRDLEPGDRIPSEKLPFN